MTAPFKDHFSRQSEIYNQFRPSYPPELFRYLASLTLEHKLAWDCATGNGQSAIGLARHYNQVYATDGSEEQISRAKLYPNITYRVEQAEHCELADRSADLITVAQALHWFDRESFYAEVRRVLKPEGVIAAWIYGLPQINPAIDKVIKDFHDHTVGAFWQAENRLVEQEYKTIAFPFKEIIPPDFIIRGAHSLDELTGLVSTWSAVQRYMDHHRKNPVQELEEKLASVWKEKNSKKIFTWNLVLRVGIIP